MLLVMVAQASVGLIETYFVGRLGTDALAGVSWCSLRHADADDVRPAPWGAAYRRRLPARSAPERRADADALVLHAMVIAVASARIHGLPC